MIEVDDMINVKGSIFKAPGTVAGYAVHDGIELKPNNQLRENVYHIVTNHVFENVLFPVKECLKKRWFLQ
jgi:hypothetical protein